jgi:hypothetical protein
VSRSFGLLAPFQFGVTPKGINQGRRNIMANETNNQFREDEIVILRDTNEKIGKEHNPPPAFSSHCRGTALKGE